MYKKASRFGQPLRSANSWGWSGGAVPPTDAEAIERLRWRLNYGADRDGDACAHVIKWLENYVETVETTCPF